MLPAVHFISLTDNLLVFHSALPALFKDESTQLCYFPPTSPYLNHVLFWCIVETANMMSIFKIDESLVQLLVMLQFMQANLTTGYLKLVAVLLRTPVITS